MSRSLRPLTTPIIYVTGSLSSLAAKDQMEITAKYLINCGYIVIAPCLYRFTEQMSADRKLAYHLRIINFADCVLIIGSGWQNTPVFAERNYALRVHIPVCFDTQEILANHPPKEVDET